MTGCAFSRYEQFETSPETIEQEMRPSKLRQTVRLQENYSIDMVIAKFVISKIVTGNWLCICLVATITLGVSGCHILVYLCKQSPPLFDESLAIKRDRSQVRS